MFDTVLWYMALSWHSYMHWEAYLSCLPGQGQGALVLGVRVEWLSGVGRLEPLWVRVFKRH